MNLLPPSFQAAALRKFLRTPVHTVNRVPCLRKPIGKYFHQSPLCRSFFFFSFFFRSGRGRKVLENFLTWVDLYRVMRDKCNSLDIFILFLDTQLVTTDFHTFKACSEIYCDVKKKRMNVNECKRVFFRTLTFEYNMRSCFGFHCVFQLFRFTFVFSINI